MSLRTPRSLLIVMALAGAAYLVVMPRFFVGHMSDDARDILAARSLLTGGYRDLQTPGHPPANFPLPGFPLVLVPFVAVFKQTPAALRVVPWLLTLASIGLFWVFLRPWIRRDWQVWIVALYALNPTTVVSGTRVIADAAFLCAILGSFILLRRALERRGQGVAALAGCVAFASITRPEGLLLIPAISLSLVQALGVRRTLFFAVPAVLPWALFSLRSRLMSGSATGYSAIWKDALPMLSSGYGPLQQNAIAQLKTWAVPLMTGWDLPWTGAFLLMGVVLGLAFFAAALIGVARVIRGTHTEGLVVFAVFTFSVLFLLLHTAWLAVDTHYLWPLLPITIAFAAVALEAAAERWHPLSAIAVAALLFLSYGTQYAFAVRQTFERRELALPKSTFDWIQANTAADAFFLTPNSSVLTLYTGRYAMALIGARDADEFRYRLAEKGITHVLMTPPAFLYVQTVAGRGPEDLWRRKKDWISGSPASFERVFEHERDQMTIYAVRSEPKLVSAYKLYLQSREALESGQPALARRLLNASFAHFHLPSALNALAVLNLTQNADLQEAREALEEALDLRPGYAVAALNLARVHVKLQNNNAARHWFTRAKEMAAAAPETQMLLAVIDEEESRLP